MFGSLVIVFPTSHQGGALVLRHEGREWTFDSSAILDNPEMTPNPSVAFVAFFSDVEHEVLPVQSGHRVTITYNLYFDTTFTLAGHAAPSAPSTGLRVLEPRGANTTAVSAALAALLADPTVLPKGGTLGFGLRHQYPLPTSWTRGDPNPLHALKTWLKGGDAALFAALSEHGHKPKLRLLFESDDDKDEEKVRILLDEPAEVDDYDMEEEDAFEALCRYFGGVLTVVRPLAPSAAAGDEEEEKADAAALMRQHKYWNAPPEKTLTLHMVTDITRYNRLRSTMLVHMGNDAGVDYMYKYVCLTVDVGPVGQRVIAGQTEEEKVPSDFASDDSEDSDEDSD